MDATLGNLPDDIDALKAALIVEHGRHLDVAAELAVAKAKASDDAALIAHQRLQIEKLRRQLYGQRSERTVQLLDQMDLAFEELESSATEDEIAAEAASPGPRMSRRSSVDAPRASPSPSICRASGWWNRDRRPACVAVARACASWARMSPRRWRSSRGNGR